MRFQLFIFNVLCLCYVISALSNKNFEETKLELNRPKRTIILTSVIKKLIWQKFSNFINLPITRRPSKIITTTERNSIPPTKQSITVGDYPLNGNKNNNLPGGATIPNDSKNKEEISPSVENYKPIPNSPEKQNDVSNSVEVSGPDQYTDPHNEPNEQQSNIYRPSTSSPSGKQYYDYDYGSSGPSAEQNYGPSTGPKTQNNRPNSGIFSFSDPEGINDLRSNNLGKQKSNADAPSSVPKEHNYESAAVEVSNAPRKQFNDYVQDYSHPSLEHNYGSQSSSSAEQNYKSPSGPEEQNYEQYYRGFPVSGPEENIKRPNGLGKLQSNSYGAPSDLSVEQNYAPTSRPSTEQNYGIRSSFKEENYATTPTTKGIVNSVTNQRNGPKLQQAEQEYQGYTQENNHKSVNQLEATISNSDASRYTGRKNYGFNNFQQQIQENNPALYSNDEHENLNTANFVQHRNSISQTNPSPSPFLINYPHHQHYQQLIPSVNKLSNSIQYADIPQNNYYQQEYVNHKEDSSDLNQFHQPLLNLYSHPKQYY